MTDLPSHLEDLRRDLDAAVTRFVAGRRRRSHRLRIAGAASALALAFSAAALASGIGPGLELDPTKWSILGGGSVDDGQGEYVHARRLEDGSNSTFMVERDQGLDRYAAFLLHERLRAAAAETSPVPVRREQGALCTRTELSRAEQVALDTLQASFPAGAPANATRATVDDA
ncbi:MAG: hypothetical protein QOF43_486, partial [Gaiellaceae bacterium]|nr:hypothetical protein [Gaiellaceae bacterium]